MNRPGTLVSKLGFTFGISTPRFSVPNTSRIACTGHATSQAPCPMQCAGLISVPLPLMMPIAVSGQALMQAPEPKHFFRSNIGCRVGGSVMPPSIASLSLALAATSPNRRLREYIPSSASSGTRYSA